MSDAAFRAVVQKQAAEGTGTGGGAELEFASDDARGWSNGQSKRLRVGCGDFENAWCSEGERLTEGCEAATRGIEAEGGRAGSKAEVGLEIPWCVETTCHDELEVETAGITNSWRAERLGKFQPRERNGAPQRTG